MTAHMEQSTDTPVRNKTCLGDGTTSLDLEGGFAEKQRYHSCPKIGPRANETKRMYLHERPQSLGKELIMSCIYLT